MTSRAATIGELIRTTLAAADQLDTVERDAIYTALVPRRRGFDRLRFVEPRDFRSVPELANPSSSLRRGTSRRSEVTWPEAVSTMTLSPPTGPIRDPRGPGGPMSTLETALEAMIERVVRKVMREREAIAAAPADELVTMATFARRRSISESTVRAAIRSGQLPAVKIGRAVRVRADAQIGKPAPSSSASTNADTPRARAARILGMKP